MPPMALPNVPMSERSGEGRVILHDVNLNLNAFWTLVVVVVVAPLLALGLCWGSLFVLLLLGWDPGI